MILKSRSAPSSVSWLLSYGKVPALYKFRKLKKLVFVFVTTELRNCPLKVSIFLNENLVF